MLLKFSCFYLVSEHVITGTEICIWSYSQAKMGMMEEFEVSLQVLRGFDTDISLEVNEIKVKFWLLNVLYALSLFQGDSCCRLKASNGLFCYMLEFDVEDLCFTSLP